MRKRVKKNGISVHAIAGSEVVLLAFDAKASAVKGLLGFTICKKKTNENTYTALPSGRVFEGTYSIDSAKENTVTTSQAPVQAFMWGDYSVDPATSYTYKVVPVYGKPGRLEPGEGVEITLSTENPNDKKHAVYFNRGVAGSQAYRRRFGNYARWYNDDGFLKQFIKPRDVPKRAAYKWLSRGLEEAMLDFINQAKDAGYSLRGAVYEFTYLPVVQALVDALERGADIKIIHHAKHTSLYKLKQNYDCDVQQTSDIDGTVLKVYKNREVVKESLKDPVLEAADYTVGQIGLKNPGHVEAFKAMMLQRTITTISHNKFLVLLRNGKPVAVWTGSTNFTEGGIFGQSNVGHVIRDTTVARKYLNYWEKLATDPEKRSKNTDPPDAGMANWTVLEQPDLLDAPPPNSITPIFSPRLDKGMLDWYAERLDNAKSSVFFTAAFSVADEIFEKVKVEKQVSGNKPYGRYLMLEGIDGYIEPKYPAMKKVSQNHLAWGDLLKGGPVEEEHSQYIETLTGLNSHVNFLHTKYMLIDPLSNSPVVISGSANFSKASTVDNDENMLVIRGNKRLADMFLGEFMRLFKHFERRNELNAMTDEEKENAYYLASDDSWTTPYYEKGNKMEAERRLFR